MPNTRPCNYIYTDSLVLWLLIVLLYPYKYNNEQICVTGRYAGKLQKLLRLVVVKEKSWCHKPFVRWSNDELGLGSNDGLILTWSPKSCRPTRSAKTDWKSYGSAWGDLTNCLLRASFSLETSSDLMWDPVCIPRKMSIFGSWWVEPFM
jgi:hypothetical protein